MPWRRAKMGPAAWVHPQYAPRILSFGTLSRIFPGRITYIPNAFRG